MTRGKSTTRRRALQLGALLLLVSGSVAIRAAVPAWAPSGAMTVARMGGLPFLLPDGRVLVVGGPSTGGAADSFDPASGTWSPGPSSASSHPQLPAAVRLLDGRILVSGGREDSGITVATADIYSPWTGDVERDRCDEAKPCRPHVDAARGRAGPRRGRVLERHRVRQHGGDLTIRRPASGRSPPA